MRIVTMICFLSVSLISCKQDVKINEGQSDAENLETIGLVELNNGALWEANSETTLGIKKMILRMDSFSEKENSLAYQNLKDSLEGDFTEIFQKCTMKGEAHNQLHNYLKPMIDLFNGLDSQELEACKTNFRDLDTHLKSYKNFFE